MSADESDVQRMLLNIAHGWQPELDQNDEFSFADWIRLEEVGLELGFEDEAFLLALDPSFRRESPPVLSQLYFYAETEQINTFAGELPFGLSFSNSRKSARELMEAQGGELRAYVRDCWVLQDYNVVIAYSISNTIESVFCYLRHAPWPPAGVDTQALGLFSFESIVPMFGERWSSDRLRTTLRPIGYDNKLPEVRIERTADFSDDWGVSLLFLESDAVPSASQELSESLCLAGVTYYASRYEDARQWPASLPHSLLFDDTPSDLIEKLGEASERDEEVLSGSATWIMDAYSLHVVYSTLENRILSVMVLAPEVWDNL